MVPWYIRQVLLNKLSIQEYFSKHELSFPIEWISLYTSDSHTVPLYVQESMEGEFRSGAIFGVLPVYGLYASLLNLKYAVQDFMK